MIEKHHSLRDQMGQIMKHELHTMLLRTRQHMDLTQTKMAEHYVMSNTSYSDLERGKTSCGTLTMLLLLNDQEDPGAALQNLVNKICEDIEE